MNDNTQVAVFIDYDNIEISVSDKLGKEGVPNIEVFHFGPPFDYAAEYSRSAQGGGLDV